MNKTRNGWSKAIKKIFSSILVFVSAFIIGAKGVSAATAPSSVILGVPSYPSMSYLQTMFPIKYTSDGTMAYCTDHDKGLGPSGLTMNNVGFLDAGVTYIIKNGYPNKKNITNLGDSYDYYVTQTALWWYFDDKGITNTVSAAYKTASDPYNLRQHIIKLKNEALNARDFQKPTISFTSSSEKMKLSSDGKYYVSEYIELNKNGYVTTDPYVVTVKNAPSGLILFDAYGNQKSTYSFGINERFMIKVPASSVNYGTTTFEISAVAKGIIEKAFLYSSGISSYQNITPVKLYDEKSDLAPTKMTLTIEKTPPTPPPTPPVCDWTKVSIIKKNAKTGEALAGAKLVIKRENGTVAVNEFETGTTPKDIINLATGKYYVEETKAPAGYTLSAEKKWFTLGGCNPITVTFENSKTPTLKFSKKDADTGALLAHAMIVIKDQDGKVVKEFESTTEPHYINLAPGKYTLQETSAPDGYVLNDKVITFEIGDGILEKELFNSKYIDVPKTDSFGSMLIYFMGTITILGSGWMIFSGVKKVY